MMTMTASDRAAFRDFAARSGVVVFVDGELDLETAPGLRPALAEMIARYPEVVLDLSGLEFCDCYGLGVLLGARTRAAGHGTRLLLARPLPPRTARLLALTGTRDVFTYCDHVPVEHEGVYVRLDVAKDTHGGPAPASA
jgi:anti-sigma B factor antagonist